MYVNAVRVPASSGGEKLVGKTADNGVTVAILQSGTEK